MIVRLYWKFKELEISAVPKAKFIPAEVDPLKLSKLIGSPFKTPKQKAKNLSLTESIMVNCVNHAGGK